MKAPDVDDRRKLVRLIKYLQLTEDLQLVLEASSLDTLKWWVDASFAVHHDMRSHTGGILSLGGGAIYGTSTRRKLNTRSSTESEIVGVSDVIGQILWTRRFMESQGYEIKECIVFQDNQSSILLVKKLAVHLVASALGTLISDIFM